MLTVRSSLTLELSQAALLSVARGTHPWSPVASVPDGLFDDRRDLLSIPCHVAYRDDSQRHRLCPHRRPPRTARGLCALGISGTLPSRDWCPRADSRGVARDSPIAQLGCWPHGFHHFR